MADPEVPPLDTPSPGTPPPKSPTLTPSLPSEPQVEPLVDLTPRSPSATAYSFDGQSLRRRNISSAIERLRSAHSLPVLSPNPRPETAPETVDPQPPALPVDADSAPASAATAPPPAPEESAAAAVSEEFSCNICFDTASSPVLTLCGHLYCWPCLHQWLQAQARNPLCPVCKAGCESTQVIPIYGRGKEPKDPRLANPDLPRRPAGQRPEPRPTVIPNNPFSALWENSTGFYNFHMGAAHPVALSAGIGFGLFPTLFGMHFNFPPPAGNEAPMSEEAQVRAQHAFISRLFLALGVLLLITVVLY